MSAGLAEPLSKALDISNPEPPTDQAVEIDTPGDQVAPSFLVGEPTTTRQHQVIENLGLDKRQIVATAATPYRCKSPNLCCISITNNPAAGSCLCLRNEHKRFLCLRGERYRLHPPNLPRVGWASGKRWVQRRDYITLLNCQVKSGRTDQGGRLRAEHDSGRSTEHDDGHRIVGRFVGLGGKDGDPVARPVEAGGPRYRYQPRSKARQPGAPLADGIGQALGLLRKHLRERSLGDRGKAPSKPADYRREVLTAGQLYVKHEPSVCGMPDLWLQTTEMWWRPPATEADRSASMHEIERKLGIRCG